MHPFIFLCSSFCLVVACLYPQIFASLHEAFGFTRQTLFLSYAFMSIPCYALNVYLWRYAGGDKDDDCNVDELPPNEEPSVEVSIVSSSSLTPPSKSKLSMSQRAKIAGSPKWSPHGKAFNQDYNINSSSKASKHGYEAVRNGGNGNGNGGGVSRATAGRSLTSVGNANDSNAYSSSLSPPLTSLATTTSASSTSSSSTCWHVSSVPLKDQPLLEQLQSKEFAFILLFAAVGILRANLYIGTNEQLLMNLGGEKGRKKKKRNCESRRGEKDNRGVRKEYDRRSACAGTLFSLRPVSVTFPLVCVLSFPASVSVMPLACDVFVLFLHHRQTTCRRTTAYIPTCSATCCPAAFSSFPRLTRRLRPR